MAKKNGIYIGSLYRFGYDLTAIGKTEKEVSDLIMEDYCEYYERYNGCDPREEADVIFAQDAGKTFYDIALEAIEINFYEFGKVEWR